ncbi:hypothetical protein VTN77DRAFT_1377 [Rasamsonia byssochlamydoides]|uniref:uncharacterized protein n=1 Tax=Rasamsonia byssochlamydoides TaxID=89139 RepID=UPI0037441769
MPLVVPGINSSMGNNNNNSRSEWINKLLGKKLTESTTDVNCFAKKDLPPLHRVLKRGDVTTMDYQPDRLNIHVDDDGTIRDVRYG